ncbi:MAG TPA: LLM class flavin-dependent oxidoreductase [Chloroflexota bacterium]
MATVELGIHAGPQDIELAELRRLWRFCDEAGFDLITCWDHFYESPPRDGNGPCYEALPTLTALALETSRARVGCLCFGMGYRNPAVLAKSLTTIDHLSQGRLTVGLGAGWHEPEHVGYGFARKLPPAKERLDKLAEGVQVIRLLLTQERSTFEGAYYRLENAANFPRPVQPRIPLIVGGPGERRTLAIAAQFGDGANQAYLALDVYRHKNEVLDHWCEVFGRDPTTLERSVILHWDLTSSGQPKPARAGALAGSPQQAIETLGSYVEAGAQRISLAIRPPVDWQALEDFMAQVMPAIRHG